jgi:hypothetical protein
VKDCGFIFYTYFLSLFFFVTTILKITKLENKLYLFFLLVCISGAAQDLPLLLSIHLLHMAEVIKMIDQDNNQILYFANNDGC